MSSFTKKTHCSTHGLEGTSHSGPKTNQEPRGELCAHRATAASLHLSEPPLLICVHLPPGLCNAIQGGNIKKKHSLLAGLPWLSRHTQSSKGSLAPGSQLSELSSWRGTQYAVMSASSGPAIVYKLRANGFTSHTLNVPWGTGDTCYKASIIRASHFPENSQAKTHGW